MNFEELYNTCKKKVFNLALQYVQNSEDAEEITQDVFVSVHNSIHKFRNEATIDTWIYRITINKSLDFIKSKKRQKRFGFISSLLQIENSDFKNEGIEFNHPGVISEQREAVAEIFNWVNDLPDNQKTALILCKIEHKTQEEAAAIMKISPKALESLVQRAKVNLAKKINDAKDNKK